MLQKKNCIAILVVLVLASFCMADQVVVGSGNLWVSMSNDTGGYELREYSVSATSSSLLNTYAAPTLFADIQYAESPSGTPTLYAVDGTSLALYTINASTGAVTTTGVAPSGFVTGAGIQAVSVADGNISVMSTAVVEPYIGYGYFNRMGTLVENPGGYYDIALLANKDDSYKPAFVWSGEDLDPKPGTANQNHISSHSYTSSPSVHIGRMIVNDFAAADVTREVVVFGNDLPFTPGVSDNAFRDMEPTIDGNIVTSGSTSSQTVAILDADGNVLGQTYPGPTSSRAYVPNAICTSKDGSLFAFNNVVQQGAEWQGISARTDQFMIYSTTDADSDGYLDYVNYIDLYPGVDGTTYSPVGAATMAWEVVPEPATMLILGIGGVAGLIRRRK